MGDRARPLEYTRMREVQALADKEHLPFFDKEPYILMSS
jgi:hypothetical protein